ncbi:DUF397 domain-containing protein [Actinomadura sp. 9N215]|uniref:DUF397 domain-containing protein n=1 Tax=Actinomadura sp. 9N215 TaxID=3375150 RepID=UPI00379D7D46
MTKWRKSSRSTSAQDSNCVEVARLQRNIGVRDSKDPNGPKLTLDAATWRTLTHRIKNGDHNLI